MSVVQGIRESFPVFLLFVFLALCLIVWGKPEVEPVGLIHSDQRLTEVRSANP